MARTMDENFKKIKYNWFQTEKYITIDILLKNMKNEHFSITFQEQNVIFINKLNNEELNLFLFSKITPSNSSYKLYPSKIELKLAKAEGFIKWWDDLISNNNNHPSLPNASSNLYPSSCSKGPKNWDKIEKEIEKEESTSKLEGEAAVSQLFQKIYADGSDDVKRAMNKSFVESGSTVLSTNWADVGKTKVDVKPPDGMEWKSYSS